MNHDSPNTDLREEYYRKVSSLRTAKKQLTARILSQNLFEFNKQVLRVEEGSGDVSLAPFHEEMCAFVQMKGLKERDQKLMLLPRGHLKSTLVTVGYCLMRIAQNPNVRILIANATYDMACSFLGQIKKHIQSNEKFIEYYGNMAQGAERWSENMITVPKKQVFGKKEATVTAYGMGGNLVSQHYDIIIGDDLINRDFISTQEQIDKTVLFYKDALDLLEPNGQFIILGTRWADGDLYGWIMDRTNTEQVYKDFSIMIKQAYTGNLETGEELEMLFPQKYSRETLMDLKRNKGPVEFSSQYMNDPLPQEKAKFKLEWFKTIQDDDLKHRDLNFFTMVDPAIGQKKTSDRTAIVTIAVDQYNNWSIVNIIWDYMLPDIIIRNVFDNFEYYHPKKVGIELVSYQKSLQYALIDEMRRRNIFLPLVELKASRSKQERIEGLIPRYANGTIFHLEQLSHKAALEDQLARFPVGKHDDIIDALAYGLQISVPARKKQTSGRTRYRENEDEESTTRRQHRYLY